MSFLGSLGNTFKDLGDAASAPMGLVYDLAKTPFDSQNDDFGTVLAKFANAGDQMASPFTDGNTWTGYSLQKLGHGLNWLYENGVDHPLSAFAIMGAHADAVSSQAGGGGALASWTHFGSGLKDMFDGSEWAQAYAIAKHQSIGQSLIYNFNSNQDPFGQTNGGTQTPFQHTLGKNPWATGSALVTDLGLGWELDPTALAGKAAGGMRVARTLHELGPDEQLNLFDRMNDQALNRTNGRLKLFLPKASVMTRTEQYLDYINGANRAKRPLNAAEIYATTPELQRANQTGKQIASLLEQTRDLHPDQVVNAQKRILAVAGGDQLQIIRLQRQIPNAASIVDGLNNISKGSTLRLQVQGLNELAQTNPAFFADFQRQMDNLDSTGEVSHFLNLVKGSVEENKATQNVAATMHFLPGAHGAGAATSKVGKAAATIVDKTPISLFAGDRALTALHQERFIDKSAAAHNAVDAWARNKSLEATSHVWQKGLNQVPLLATRTVGMPLSVYTKWPQGITNALRQTHYTGVANLEQWSDATNQVDSMMHVAGVDDDSRLKLLSQAYGAKTEMDKVSIIHRAEAAAFDALVKDYNERTGQDIDRNFVQNLVAKGQDERARRLGSISGHVYAATTNPESNARIDTFYDHDGVPFAMPVLSTQLQNQIPMVDVELAKKMLNRTASTQRLRELSETWRSASRDLDGLQARLVRGSAKTVAAAVGRNGDAGADDIKGAIQHVLDAKDWTLDGLNNLTRVWKFGVLFRLGFPQRVVADDQARIISQLHNISFYKSNIGEAVKNLGDNAPLVGQRWNIARTEYSAAKARREMLKIQYGQDALSLDNHNRVIEAARIARTSKDDDEVAQAEKTLRRLDPDGLLREYYDRDSEISALTRKLSGHRAQVTKMERGAETEDIPVDTAKMSVHQAEIENLEQAIAFKMDQQGEDPAVLREQLVALNKLVDKGPRAFLPAKLKIGDREIKLEDGTKAQGALADPIYRALASSHGTFEQSVQVDGENSVFSALDKGAFHTIAPVADNGAAVPGHLHAWADVLNHQVKNSPEAMFFLHNPQATASDFAEWVKSDENAHLRERVAHFAHDPEDWGGRVQALVDDYVRHPDIRDALLRRQVTDRDLAKAIPDPTRRPIIHGQTVDVNTGRHRFQRTASAAVGRIYKALGETPTDMLSRHPFFNAVYKKELQKAYTLRKIAHAQEGLSEPEARFYTQADLDSLQLQARKVALSEVKNLLWDVTSHTHAAHWLRYISPFFAAHQEALTRWWRVASDDPSVVRRFTQVFDVPVKMGLVYNQQTGKLVQPGDGVSQNNIIMLRIPAAFGGSKNPMDKWLKEMGGGKYWRVNENGFNVIMQNGLNPGGGPLVTVPLEAAARKYANEPALAQASSVLNGGYSPSGSSAQMFMPGWLQRVNSLVHHDSQWTAQYQNNIADGITTWRLAHDGADPSQGQFQKIADRAGRDTTRDMALMLFSNSAWFTPAKPTSKYAVGQDGWQQIIQAADATGKNFTWAKQQFDAKYGDAYDALILSGSDNPAGYEGTPGEIAATEKYRSLIAKAGDYNPKLASVVVGPEAQFLTKQNAQMGQYTPEARYWLEHHSLNEYTDQPFVGSKSVEQTFVEGMLADGWQKYDELNNGLNQVVAQAGLSSYRESPALVAARKNAVAQLAKMNPIWGQSYADNASGSIPYDQTFKGLQVIAKSNLADKAERGDITALREYVQMRDAVTSVLKANGLSYESVAARPVLQQFAGLVQQLVQQSTYFDRWVYQGTVEFDPLLKYGGLAPQTP